MDSKGADLFCTACGKRWHWHEDGRLEATEGETEFDHIPDWFEWERSEVRRQLEEEATVNGAALLTRIEAEKKLTDEIDAALKDFMTTFKSRLKK